MLPQEERAHDSKVVAVGVVERAAVRTCLVGEACAGVASVIAGSLGPMEQNTMMVRQAERSSPPTFATDAHEPLN